MPRAPSLVKSSLHARRSPRTRATGSAHLRTRRLRRLGPTRPTGSVVGAGAGTEGAPLRARRSTPVGLADVLYEVEEVEDDERGDEEEVEVEVEE